MKDINVYYDKVQALIDISLDVAKGSVITLVGANGAGKSTTLRTISGLKRASSGEILFEDKRIDSLPIDEIVKLGIIHVAEGANLFPYLSVLDNIKIGAYLQKGNDLHRQLDEVYERFPVLHKRAKQLATTLSGGEKQMLAVARAMVARPKLLLMDEPTLGLSPIMAKEIAKIIKNINSEGVSVILVEQNASIALTLAQTGYVMEIGRIVMVDEAAKLMNDDHVRVAYLGG
jgi:branched-chain amino acid transport system ATP-binding protein